MMSTPPATTATVPAASAPSCAAASMPRARPDTTTSPAAPRSRARMPANLRASAEALRAPTMAIISRLQQMRRGPARRSPAAADPAPRGRAENPASQDAISRPPSFASASSLARRCRLPAAARSSCRRRARARRGTSASAARGRAEARDQAGEGDRADILGARQPEPGAAFAVVKRSHRLCSLAPMRGSSPRSRRRIFSRCMKKISSASSSASAA